MHAVKAARGEDDVARHLIFAGLDVALGALVAWRPRWALAPVAALSLQQVGSHGRDLVASLRGSGPVDVASLGVLAFFAALVVLLVAVRRASPTTSIGSRDGGGASGW